jgi:hypothetical protein
MAQVVEHMPNKCKAMRKEIKQEKGLGAVNALVAIP